MQKWPITGCISKRVVWIDLIFLRKAKYQISDVIIIADINIPF